MKSTPPTSPLQNLRRFPVPLIIALILFIYIATLHIIDASLSYYSASGLLHTMLLSIWTLGCLACYMTAVMTDPGTVPHGYTPPDDKEQGDAALVHVVKKSTGEARYCRKCSVPQFKPPRTHHCKKCKRCVLRMCHHCPWLNTCIGHMNYRAYFLFLLYCVLSLGEATVLQSTYAWTGFRLLLTSTAARAQGQLDSYLDQEGTSLQPISASANTSASWIIFVILTILVTMGLLLAIGSLFVWHLFISIRNKTTIEYYEGLPVKADNQELAPLVAKERHLYDLGIFENLDLILGENPLVWFWPWPAKVQGDGLTFPTYVERLARRQAQIITTPQSIPLQPVRPKSSNLTAMPIVSNGGGVMTRSRARTPMASKPTSRATSPRRKHEAM